ncbi:uncharacterized protein LOC134854607 isoform X2 [Symsagittifera roscoffensis]|uniref:uncharacterized protein LOC134854607 isoform X2 n=1 Tax=Symsagittifera roscoffensis TaxID=84072 RepID=UPI00307C6792
MGGIFSSPSDGVFDQPDSELFDDFFYFGGIKFSSEQIKLDQTQSDGGNNTRRVDAKLDSRLLFGSRRDMMHLGKNQAFPFNGHLPNGKEPLTTLRASIIVNKDSLKINKEVNDGFAMQTYFSGPQEQELNQYIFSCSFVTDVPGRATLYQRATEVFMDGKLCFNGEILHEMKFEKPTDGAPVDFEALVPIDHEGLVKEWEKYSEGKKDGKNKNTPTPLVLHLEADENHHPGHSHTAFMSLDQSGSQYSVKLEKLYQCSNGVVYLMQEIYNAIAETTEHSGDGERGLAEEDAIASRAKSPSLDCTMCLEEPMMPFQLVLQIFFLKTESECSIEEKEAAASLEHALSKQDRQRDNTYGNQAESGRVPQGMLRLPIGIVICPPGKSSPEATAGIDGRSKSRSNISRRGYDTQWSENSAASITIDKPENILLPYKPADNTEEKDQLRNENIQCYPAIVAHNSRVQEDYQETVTPLLQTKQNAANSGDHSAGALKPESFELALRTTNHDQQTNFQSMGGKKTPAQTASDYVNWGSLNSTDRASSRPTTRDKITGASGCINSENPPPVPARDPNMQGAHHKFTSVEESGLDR